MNFKQFLLNENKQEIINEIKNEKKINEKVYGYQILNEISKTWNNLPDNQKEIYKNIAKYINEEPDWLKDAENNLNSLYNITLDISYKRLYGL